MSPSGTLLIGALLLGDAAASPAACFALRSPSPMRPARRCTSHLSMSDTGGVTNKYPAGSAARPLDRRRVAIFGAGGYLGATIFGFLQRASSIYGTGISNRYSPRAILGSSVASAALNRVLTSSFKLAYAGRNQMALADMMDEESISPRLVGFDALILGTRYATERWPVTGGRWGKLANAKTYEFLLDGPRGGSTGGPVDGDDPAHFHVDAFRRQVRAAAAAGSIRHVFVVGTPAAAGAEAEYAAILDEEATGRGLPFTYLRTGAAGLTSFRDYSFVRGVVAAPDALAVRGSTLSDGYRKMPGYRDGDWMQGLLLEEEEENGGDRDGDDTGVGTVAREDLAALVVQSVLSLDWSKSRVLELRCAPGGLPESMSCAVVADDNVGRKKEYGKKPARTDIEWCVNSSVLAQKLKGIE